MPLPTKLGYWKFLRSYRGVKTTLQRAGRIYARYGFSPRQLIGSISEFIDHLQAQGCSLTLPVTAQVVSKFPRVFRELSRKGVEFAVHGLAHLDYTLLAPERVERDLRQALSVFEQAGVPVSGFRFPYLRCNRALLQILERLPFEYDSSIPCFWPKHLDILRHGNGVLHRMIDQYQPTSPERVPVLPAAQGPLVELPVSLPDDDILFDRIPAKRRNVVSGIWIAILQEVHARGELFVLQLHPERYRFLKNALAAVLEEAASLGGVWIAPLGEIVRWWKRRREWKPALSFADGQVEVVVDLSPAFQAALLEPARREQPEPDWQAVVRDGHYRYRGTLLPFIGLGEGVGTGFESRLRDLGFYTTREFPPRQTSVFLAREPEEDNLRLWLRQLRAHLPGPLIRIAPWPEGYCCALAITGDIDALTIQDFFHRIHEY